MKWRSHIALTFSIISRHFKYFFNDEEFIRGLKEGLIEVDEKSDLIAYANRGAIYWYKTPHHSPASKKFAKYYAYLSLYFLRNGAQFMAGKMLGRALHYVQDMSISPKAILQHTLIEDIVDALIAKGVPRVQPTNEDIDEVVSVRGSRDAEDAVRIAAEKTYALLSWFESESSKDVDVAETLGKLRRVEIAKRVASILITIGFLWFLDHTFLQLLGGLFEVIRRLFDPSTWYAALIILLIIAGVCYVITSPIRGLRTKAHWDAFKAGLSKLEVDGALY